MSAYDLLFRHFFAKLDPEKAHHLAFRAIRLAGTAPLAKLVGRLTRPHEDLAVTALGIRFPSPFGLAAGFDKDGVGVMGLGALGFGHVEVGTLTAKAQPGNPQPRLFRLVPDRALINRMGFNNGGSAAAAARLARLAGKRGRPVLGVNIGKSRVVEVDDATSDYVVSARALAPVADYLVVNVSSPNTPGLRGLQELDRMEPLLVSVREAAGTTPLLVKIAPDLTDEQVRRIAELALRLELAGVIATNTTLSREGLRTKPEIVEAAGAGGLSGLPLEARSVQVLRVLREVLPASVCVISVGGVDSAADVQARLDAGATLVQGYTAFIYRGPLWARHINRGLEEIRRVRGQLG